ncbi:hypothetical protein BH09ACT12_BH09ACT12_15160 [soil metagenome]
MNEHDLMQALEGRAAEVDPAGPPTGAMIGRAATVRKRRTALSVVAAAAVVAVIATTVSLVGLGDDKADDLDVVSPDGPSQGFAEALAVLPEGTGTVYFNDSVAAANRLGLQASTMEEYNQQVIDYLIDATAVEGQDPGGLFGPSSVYVEQTAELPFNEFGVQWAVQGAAKDGLTFFTVYKMRPDTDLDAIADDLVAAGLQEEDLLGRRYLVADTPQSVTSPQGIIGDGYPREFTKVTVDTAADLLIVGNQSEQILEVLDGDRASVADSGTFAPVLGDIQDVERATLEVGESCLFRQRDKPAGLQKPTQSGYLIHGDDAELTARLLFDDEATAAADLEARKAHFDAGPLGEDDAPLDSYGSYDATQDGPVIDIEFDDMRSETLSELINSDNILGC